MHSQLISIDREPDQLDPVRRRGLLAERLQPPGRRHPVGTDTGGSGLKNIRYTTDGSDPDRLEPGLHRPDHRQRDHDDQVARRGQRRQRRVAGPLADDLDRHRRSRPARSSATAQPALPSYDHPVDGNPVGDRHRRLGREGDPLHDRRLDADRLEPGLLRPDRVDATTTIKWRAEDNAGNVDRRSTRRRSRSPRTAAGGRGALAAWAARCSFSSKSLPNGTVKLTLDVTGPGELDVADASVAGASAVAAKKRASRIKPTSRSVAQAGDGDPDDPRQQGRQEDSQAQGQAECARSRHLQRQSSARRAN